MREVNVRWMRIVLPLVALGLFVAVLTYEDRDRGLRETFDAFQPKALQDRIWFGDPMTPADWVGELNYLAVVAYLAPAFMLAGRIRWGGIVGVYSVVAVVAVAAAGGIVYLAATDAASFPVSSRGMQAILLFHTVGIGALVAGFGQLRRAALAPDV